MNEANQEPIEFSIVIPTFNCADLLDGALKSISAQEFRRFEVIVSDGASRDATLQVAESYRDRLPSLVIRSERDKGVYDAMNQAIRLCRGRWVVVLGADDRLHDDRVLLRAADALQHSTAGLAYGDVRVIGVNSMTSNGGRYGGPFDLARLLGQNICQQAIFYSPEMLRRLGGFDLRFKLWADWDLAQRAFVTERFQWIDLVIADYAATGMSSKNVDETFRKTQSSRLVALWLRKPWSLQVPMAILRNYYWSIRKT